MGPRRSAASMAALCGTFVLAGWGAAGVVSVVLPGIEDRASPIATPQASAPAQKGVRLSVAATERVGASFSDLATLPPAATVHAAPAVTPDPAPSEVAAAMPPAEAPAAETTAAETTAAETTEVASRDTVPDLPTPPRDAPPAPSAPAHTADAAPNEIAAALPAETAELASLDTVPDPDPITAPAAPPVETLALSTPDQNDVAAATPDAEAAETVSIAAWPRTLHAPGAQLASLGTPDPVQNEVKPAAELEIVEECLVPEICIDQYLWAHYQRTLKVDTNKVVTRIKATVRHKGKTRTVTKTFTRYVVADFTWKDPAAAEKVGMSLKDYVIGGMDRGFKLKLYRALRAMNEAGLMPGITSAFRDDYRQSIASGNKAASDSSFHGGSRRGGYGYGMAADLVSTKGATRLERFASSRELWSWIDAREKELAIGRPYLDRDPPHVGPIDGKEFSAKRGSGRAKLAALVTKRHHVAARDEQGAAKRATR